MRNVIKKTLKVLFLGITSPIYLLYMVFSFVENGDSSFSSFSQLLSLVPGKIGIYIRAAFYRLACPDTSDDITIGFLTVFSHRDTTIHKGAYIGPQCNIGKCTIGENTLIGSGVHILSGNKQHTFVDFNKPIKDQGGVFEKIIIGEDCWIGNGSIISQSVASQSIVASGAVLTKKVLQPGSIVGGNPANLIKTRSNQGFNSET